MNEYANKKSSLPEKLKTQGGDTTVRNKDIVDNNPFKELENIDEDEDEENKPEENDCG